MTLSEIIQASKELGVWIHEHTNDTQMPNDRRKRIGLSIFQQSMDIGDAILIILESNLPGPAFALARPLLESYVRGVWLLNHASEEQIDKFMKGKCPKFPTLLNQIGDDPDTGGAWIRDTTDLNLKAFHDLTHGGIEHVVRRVTENYIEPNYPEEESIRLMKLRNEVQINIATFLLALLKNEDALKKLYEKSKHYRAMP